MSKNPPWIVNFNQIYHTIGKQWWLWKQMPVIFRLTCTLSNIIHILTDSCHKELDKNLPWLQHENVLNKVLF